MSLTTDADYLIHMMRIKLLRMDERGERIISFPPSVMSDDYIRLAAPTYPEMQYCYSPTYSGSQLGEKLLSPGLKSSPRTQRTHYQLRKKREMMRAAKHREMTSSEDETEADENDPTEFTTAAGSARKISDTSGFRSSEASTSYRGNAGENATTPLQPSVDTNVEPSSRSSLDVSGTAPDTSLGISSSMSQVQGADTHKSQQLSLTTSFFSQPSHLPPLSSPLPPLQYTKMDPLQNAQTQPVVSTLSALIAEKASGEENPFEGYSHVCGKGDSNAITLCVYLPHSNSPRKPVSLIVRKEAVIDDVIGYILFDYEDQQCLPKIDDDAYDLTQWVLLIAEDDGEIEDDLPALDRTRRIDQVAFDQFALCRANPAQVKQNVQMRAKLGRKGPGVESPQQSTNGGGTTSRHLTSPASGRSGLGSQGMAGPTGHPETKETLRPDGPTLARLPGAAEADSSSVAVPVPSSKAVLTKSTIPMTPIKHFKIRLMTNDEVDATTTIPVYAEMFVGDVLELVSRKRKFSTQDYVLMIPDTSMIVPNDTPVDELKDIVELTLTRKGSVLTTQSSSNHYWRSPIRKKKDEPQMPLFLRNKSSSSNDNTLSQYKKYNVNRKMPIVGKRMSVLIIDGEYIRLMPPENKSMFDSMKVTTFHTSAIQTCKQSKKDRSNLKISVKKEYDNRTYELEAESTEEAHEICTRIRFLMQRPKQGVSL